MEQVHIITGTSWDCGQCSQEIKGYRHLNPNYNAAGCLKMMGKNLNDPRSLPKDISFSVNNKKLLAEWMQNMNHDVSIKTCGTCGRQVVMTEGEYHLLPSTSKLLSCCKADGSELPPRNSLKYKALHLKELNNEIFKLSDKGIRGQSHCL